VTSRSSSLGEKTTPASLARRYVFLLDAHGTPASAARRRLSAFKPN
jgi:hypothetical protein